MMTIITTLRQPTLWALTRVHSQVIDTARGQALADEFGIKFFETSAKNNINVEKAFFEIAREVMKGIAEKVYVASLQPHSHVNTTHARVVALLGVVAVRCLGTCSTSSPHTLRNGRLSPHKRPPASRMFCAVSCLMACGASGGQGRTCRKAQRRHREAAEGCSRWWQ